MHQLPFIADLFVQTGDSYTKVREAIAATNLRVIVLHFQYACERSALIRRYQIDGCRSIPILTRSSGERLHNDLATAGEWAERIPETDVLSVREQLLIKLGIAIENGVESPVALFDCLFERLRPPRRALLPENLRAKSQNANANKKRGSFHFTERLADVLMSAGPNIAAQ
jgi:hypothetical protein